MPKIPFMPKITMSKPATYIGIDPGKSGGITEIIVFGDGAVSVVTHKMPQTEVDMLQFFKPSPNGHRIVACVEKVGGYVGDKGNTGSSMFEFGFATGGIRMACLAAGIPLEEVQPTTWQKFLGIPRKKKDETKTQWKNRLRAHAQRLYPSIEISLQVADSVLIADYLLRKRQGA